MKNNNFDYAKVIMTEAIKFAEYMITLMNIRHIVFNIDERDEDAEDEVWECYGELNRCSDNVVESYYADLYLYTLRLYMNGDIDSIDKQLILNTIDMSARKILRKRWDDRVCYIINSLYGDDASDELDEIFDECNDCDDCDDCNDCNGCNDCEVYDTTGDYDDNVYNDCGYVETCECANNCSNCDYAFLVGYKKGYDACIRENNVDKQCCPDDDVFHYDAFVKLDEYKNKNKYKQ